jgi:hypothetical protein
MLPTLNCGVEGEADAPAAGLNGEPNPAAPTCLTGEEFLDKACKNNIFSIRRVLYKKNINVNNKLLTPRLGRGSLSQSLENTLPSLTAEVNFPLRISSTRFFSTSDLHI